MNFRENLKLRIPAIEESGDSGVQFSELFSPERQTANKGLVVQFAAIHEGRTANNRIYGRDELERATASWTQPYSKPLIVNHDVYEKPLGRITEAEMSLEEDGQSYSAITVSVLDPEAVEMINDGRYQTGSVGGSAESAICNICGEDWAKVAPWERDCEHAPGKEYDGVKAGLIMRGITWREYSLVNVPADSNSRVLKVGHSDENPEEIDNSDRVDTLEFRVVDLEESDKDKMAFQESAGIAVAAEEDDSMTAPFLNDENKIEEEEETPVVTEDEQAAPEESSDDAGEQDATAEEDADEDDELLEVAETLADDLATELSTEEEEEEEEESAAEEADEVEEEDETPAAEEELETLRTQLATAEEDNERLESELEEARETNKRLKAALKRSLVERVVDAKIDRNIIAREDRSEAIEEHSKRTPTSLSDTLKDTLRIPSTTQSALDAHEAYKQEIDKESVAIDENEDGLEDDELSEEDRQAEEEDISGEEEVTESDFESRFENLLHRQINGQ